MEIDPVCGMEVDAENAVWTAEYDGTIYYFCSPGCRADFENNPEKFLKLEAE
ncbi:MAG TPA: YHS domain-containing protein [Anaerolineales bacterium]|jgi:YHS domain-containing protein